MPVVVKKIGNKYGVVEKGKRTAPAGRMHSTKAAATKQMQAINISMAQRGDFGKAAQRKVKKK